MNFLSGTMSQPAYEGLCARLGEPQSVLHQMQEWTERDTGGSILCRKADDECWQVSFEGNPDSREEGESSLIVEFAVAVNLDKGVRTDFDQEQEVCRAIRSAIAAEPGKAHRLETFARVIGLEI